MWIYEKRLIYPVKISCPNPRMAKIIAGLLGSAAGEMTASMTYLNQRFGMPDKSSAAVLTDIGTEELAHLEMLQAMLMQSLKGASNEALRAAGMDGCPAVRRKLVFGGRSRKRMERGLRRLERRPDSRPHQRHGCRTESARGL